MPNNPYGVEGAALLGIVALYGHTPEGRKILAQIIMKYLDTCGRVMEACSDVKSFDWLSGLNNNYQTLVIAHRLGLVADGDLMRVEKHYQSIFDKELVQSYVFAGLKTLDTFVGGTTIRGAAPAGGTAPELKGLAALANIKGLAP